MNDCTCNNGYFNCGQITFNNKTYNLYYDSNNLESTIFLLYDPIDKSIIYPESIEEESEFYQKEFRNLDNTFYYSNKKNIYKSKLRLSYLTNIDKFKIIKKFYDKYESKILFYVPIYNLYDLSYELSRFLENHVWYRNIDKDKTLFKDFDNLLFLVKMVNLTQKEKDFNLVSANLTVDFFVRVKE